MIPKLTKLNIDVMTHEAHFAPIVHYANADFGKRGALQDASASHIVRWAGHAMGGEWTQDEVRRYLSRHQDEFRECLKWIAEKCQIDLGRRFSGESRFLAEYRELWNKAPQVVFLRRHALEHAAISVAPQQQEGYWFGGLQLEQQKAKDPLDLMCWSLLWGVSHGRAIHRFCGHCGKCFYGQTTRKLFCSDSCRALERVAALRREAAAGKDGGKYEKFLERRREDARKHRNHPLVKKRAAAKLRKTAQ